MITPHTQQWFNEAFKNTICNKETISHSATICKIFNICGICDPEYIGRTIALNSKDDAIKRIKFCYGISIKQSKHTVKQADEILNELLNSKR